MGGAADSQRDGAGSGIAASRQNRRRRRALLRAAGIALGLAAAGTALAHTAIQPKTIREGERAELGVRIGHGCGERPVLAQRAVFPGAGAQRTVSGAAGPAGATLEDAIGSGTLDGLLELAAGEALQQELQSDASGRAIGFASRARSAGQALASPVPFALRAPRFRAQSCAKRLVLQVAVADICDAASPWTAKGHANLWIPDNDSRYAVQGRAAEVDGIGKPAQIAIERDLAANPLPASCGEGYELTLTPSPDQIDRELGLAGES